MYIYIILYLVYLHYTQGPLSTWRLTRSIKNPYLLVYVSQLGISCFKIWSKIIERCLVKLNCFPICYDFFLVCFHEKFDFKKFFESFKVKNLPGWELKRRIHPWRRCTCSLRIWTSRSLWGGWPRCIRKVRHDIVFLN